MFNTISLLKEGSLLQGWRIGDGRDQLLTDRGQEGDLRDFHRCRRTEGLCSLDGTLAVGRGRGMCVQCNGLSPMVMGGSMKAGVGGQLGMPSGL